MKKTIKIIYIVCIFVLLCIPVGLMHFYENENTENRVLAQRPSLVTEEGINQNFSEGFENYIADNFAFRDKLVNANSAIKSHIFSVSGNDKVTEGKEKWLFYAETLDDFTSKNTLSDREAFCAARTVELMSEYTESKNKKFIFTIAPNKASLYPQFLPYYYIRSNQPNNMQKILSRMDKVDYFDAETVFRSTDEVLYHRLDSHWNNKGALKVAQELFSHMGISIKTYSEPEKRQDWKGDLSEILYPAMDYKDDQFYYNDSEFDYTNTSRFRSVDDMTINTQSSSTNGSILVFRDSFGRSLYPFIADNFSEARLSRSVPYDLTDTDYDYILLEIVERNLDDLIAKAPCMEAPLSEKDKSSLVKLEKDQYEITAENGELNHIYGRINTEISEDTLIYADTGNGLYEAFPCYELNEDEEPDGKGNGFSLYTKDNTDNINLYISK